MLSHETSEATSPALGMPLINERRVENAGASLPSGTIVVSADSHFPLHEDIWIDRVPDRLKDRMVQCWWDESAKLHQLGVRGVPLFPERMHRLFSSMEDIPSTRDFSLRMKDLDAERVAKEIVFPHNILGALRWPDFEVREWIFRAHNEYMADVHKRAPDRFFPVAVANVWDVARAADSVREIKSLGFKTLLIPMDPGPSTKGEPIYYSGEQMDPLWSAIEESGMPVCFHIGEGAGAIGPANAFVVEVVQLMVGIFRKNFAQLSLGGIFDRHPGLRVVFAEGGISWVPSCLQDAEFVFDSFNPLFEYRPKHRPSWYWRNHCYATFMVDDLGLSLLDRIGADRVMWSVDYPHNEGTFGYSQRIMQEIVSRVSADDARKILGGTAIEVFDLPRHS